MTVTKTIGTSGRDYSTLAAWAAALPATLADAYVGECYNDSEFTSSGDVLTLSGHTTTASFNITLTTGPGQSFRDNANAQTNALRYNQANGVGIRTTASNYQIAINNGCNYTNFTNLQLTTGTVGSGTGNSRAFVSNALSYVALDSCLLQSPSFSQTLFMYDGPSGTCFVRNSLVIGLSASGRIAYLGHGAAAEFCTFVCPSDIGGASIQIVYSGNTLKNCAFFGIKSGGLPTSGATYTTCATDQASPPTGCTTLTYASQFVGTTSSAMDFRIPATSGLIGIATADPTYGAFDIVGTARPQGGNWDVGAWEYTAGVALYTRPRVMVLS